MHPNILSLLGVVSQPGSTVLIVNLVDGPDLDSLLFGKDKVLYSIPV